MVKWQRHTMTIWPSGIEMTGTVIGTRDIAHRSWFARYTSKEERISTSVLSDRTCVRHQGAGTRLGSCRRTMASTNMGSAIEAAEPNFWDVLIRSKWDHFVKSSCWSQGNPSFNPCQLSKDVYICLLVNKTKTMIGLSNKAFGFISRAKW